MTLMTESEIRQAFAALRKLTVYSGPHGNQSCVFEETLVELARREARAPIGLTGVDGFPSGGNGGGGVSRNDAGQPASSTERATLALLDADDDKGETLLKQDPVGARTVSALFTLSGLQTGADRIRKVVTEAEHLSSLRKPRAHVAEVCGQDGCDDLAVAKGNCDSCRKWLERHPDVTRVPVKVLEARNQRRSGKPVHVDGPLAPDYDPVVERLTDDFDEATS